MRQQDPLPRKLKQPQPPAVPFDPNNPSTWPQATPSNLAELQAKAGYKPLTGKATGTPVQPDTNMYNAGTMDVLRGAGNAFVRLGDEVFKKPAQSALRTLSTQNLQTAINPKSTATERINAIGEDALNLISFIPTAKAAAEASIPAEIAIRNWLYKKSAAGKAQLAKEAQEASFANAYNIYNNRLRKLSNIEGNIQADRSVMLGELKRGTYHRPEWTKLQPWEEGYDPNIMRVWHTSPSGEQLPYPLRSMEDSARLEARRGSGATQLFSGGLYKSNAGNVSHEYLNNPPAFTQFPSPNVDAQYLENSLQVPARGKVVGFNGRVDMQPLGMSANETNERIVRMQIDDYLSKIKSVDDPIGPDLAKILRADQNLSIREILDSADSAESAQAIVDKLPFPVSFKASQNGIPERVRFKYPVISADGKKWISSATATTADPVYIAGIRAREGISSEWSEDLMSELRRLANEWEADRVRRFKEIYPDREPDFVTNPYREAALDLMYHENRPKWQSIVGNHMGGQNYWDMPITRGPSGDITSAFGMPALDITDGVMTQANADKLADLVSKFMKQELPNARHTSEEVRNIVDQIKNLPNAQYSPTTSLSHIQSSIDNLLIRESPLTNSSEFSPKERLWMFLRDNGVEVLPHQGGAMTSGVSHQALVVNSPEKLPKANYLPSTYEILGKMNEDLMAVREQRIREFTSALARAKNPRAESEAFLKNQLNRAGNTLMNKAKLSAIRSVMAGNASNSARNR